HLGAFAGPVLLVTHDPAEAVALGDRVVVVEGGTVTQVGTPAEVAAAPASPWVARMLTGG
ncbi:MAG: ABC transporter ATP-binding protein, partial [Nitriliruptoraceae bacterium]